MNGSGDRNRSRSNSPSKSKKESKRRSPQRSSKPVSNGKRSEVPQSNIDLSINKATKEDKKAKLEDPEF